MANPTKPEADAGTVAQPQLVARVPQELHEEVRIQAIRERRSLSALVQEAVEQYLERATKPKAKATA